MARASCIKLMRLRTLLALTPHTEAMYHVIRDGSVTTTPVNITHIELIHSFLHKLYPSIESDAIYQMALNYWRRWISKGGDDRQFHIYFRILRQDLIKQKAERARG